MLFLFAQDDVGQQRPQAINIPVETEAKSSTGSVTGDQLRQSLKSLDEMKTRFDEERNQWNAERDQLRKNAVEVNLLQPTDKLFKNSDPPNRIFERLCRTSVQFNSEILKRPKRSRYRVTYAWRNVNVLVKWRNCPDIIRKQWRQRVPAGRSRNSEVHN